MVWFFVHLSICKSLDTTQTDGVIYVPLDKCGTGENERLKMYTFIITNFI